MDWPLVSFVILTHNRRDQLVHTIMSARNQQYPKLEIVVVDNASTDGTAEFVRSCFPSVKVVANRKNVGTATGRNRGIEASSGEFIVFLDDDCVLEGDAAVGSVVTNFRADPECGAVAFRIADPRTGKEWPYSLRVGPEVPMVYECARFCTGGVAIRRKTLEEVGLFWEPYFIGGVDTDLALRIVASGWRIMRRTDVQVWHPSPKPGAPLNPEREIYFKVRNSIWLALRVIPLTLMLSLLVPRFGRALSLAIRMGKLPLFIRGIIDSLRELPRCLEERRPIPRAWARRARKLSMKLWT